eukprot:UC1_evm2s98
MVKSDRCARNASALAVVALLVKPPSVTLQLFFAVLVFMELLIPEIMVPSTSVAAAASEMNKRTIPAASFNGVATTIGTTGSIVRVPRRHAGLDCRAGAGAVDLEHPTGASAGNMDLASCLKLCRNTLGCTAVTTRTANIAWQQHVHTNCYANHGARELVDGDGTTKSCFVMTLSECRSQCVLTPECTGVEWNTSPIGGGECCLRADIELEKCISGPTAAKTWALHMLVWPGRVRLPLHQRPCRRRSNVNISACDTTSEPTDTYVNVVANTLQKPQQRQHEQTTKYVTTTTTTTNTTNGSSSTAHVSVRKGDSTASPPSSFSPGQAATGFWWLTTHFAERSFMPRHWSCNTSTPNRTCTLSQLQRLLPSVRAQGYSVVNVDWPVYAGPDSLYEGFGARDYWRVDPALGTDEDWARFVSTAHQLGLRVVADFNPSYFWTGAPAFQRAMADVKRYGVPPNSVVARVSTTAADATAWSTTSGVGVGGNDSDVARTSGDDGGGGRSSMPMDSPARWFLWTENCSSTAPLQPSDANPHDGVTNGWVRSPTAGGACYYSIWGQGQPCANLAAPEWQAELTRIVQHWVRDRGLSGFMLDAPGFYLTTTPPPLPNIVTAATTTATNTSAAPAAAAAAAAAAKNTLPTYYSKSEDPLSGLHDDLTRALIRRVIVEPAHALGAAVFGETYNLGRPPLTKMLDGGRNTDMPNTGNGGDGYPGFPGRLHALVVDQNATGLETLLSTTVDVLAGWTGGGVRTEPDARGPAPVAALKAAVTALTGSYYVVRMGPYCSSPYHSYGPPSSGDEWPGGCFGKWVGATPAVAATLKALPGAPALHPGTPRRVLRVNKATTYAALRLPAVAIEWGDSHSAAAGNLCEEGAIIVFNFAATPQEVQVDLSNTPVARPQVASDIIDPQAAVTPISASTALWHIKVAGYGWRALSVQLVGCGGSLSDG